MISKTACQHCGQHIEFEVETATPWVECPTCARPTRLIDGSGPNVGIRVRWWRGWRLWVAIGWVLTVCALAAVLVKVATTQPEILEVIGGGAFGVVMGVLLVVWAVLWLLFPVFVYLSLKEIISLLKQIRDK
jgi:hypothetical protein